MIKKGILIIAGALAALSLLSSCGEKIGIKFEKLSGKNGMDFGTPIMSLNFLRTTYKSQLLRRGDNLLVALPDDKGVIHTTKPVSIKGTIVSTYDYDMNYRNDYNNNNLSSHQGLIYVSNIISDYYEENKYNPVDYIWVSSKMNDGYYLTCYQLSMLFETYDIDLKQFCQVKTDTPLIIEAINDYPYTDKYPFIVCQSLDYSKVAYYDTWGKKVNSYDIEKTMIVRTRDKRPNHYFGFDGKSIFTMSVVRSTYSIFGKSQKFDIGEEFSLDKTQCWAKGDNVFIYSGSTLYVANCSLFTEKQITALTRFDDVLEVYKNLDCFRRSNGINNIELSKSERKFIEKKLFYADRCWELQYSGDSYYYHSSFIIENNGKYRIVFINKYKDDTYEYLYSDFIDTDKPLLTTGEYIFNADGVWSRSIETP